MRDGSRVMANFEAPDPTFADKARDGFSRMPFMSTIGANLTSVEPGRCEISLPFADAITQQHGFFHGGVVGTIADTAAGFASFSLMPVGSAVLTVEFKLNLVAPSQGDALVARAEVLRPGRTLIVAQTYVYARQGEKETLSAIALGTFMCLAGKLDAQVTAVEKSA